MYLLLAIFRLITESVTNPEATFLFIMTVFIAFISNAIFNYFIVFGKVPFSRIKRLSSALIVSVLTAPYMFLFGFKDILISIGL